MILIIFWRSIFFISYIFFFCNIYSNVNCIYQFNIYRPSIIFVLFFVFFQISRACILSFNDCMFFFIDYYLNLIFLYFFFSFFSCYIFVMLFTYFECRAKSPPFPPGAIYFFHVQLKCRLLIDNSTRVGIGRASAGCRG